MRIQISLSLSLCLCKPQMWKPLHTSPARPHKVFQSLVDWRSGWWTGGSLLRCFACLKNGCRRGTCKFFKGFQMERACFFHNPQPYQLSLPAATAWQERFVKNVVTAILGSPEGPQPQQKTSNQQQKDCVCFLGLDAQGPYRCNKRELSLLVTRS